MLSCGGFGAMHDRRKTKYAGRKNVRLKYIVVDDQQQQQHPGNRFLDVCEVAF